MSLCHKPNPLFPLTVLVTAVGNTSVIIATTPEGPRVRERERERERERGGGRGRDRKREREGEREGWREREGEKAR